MRQNIALYPHQYLYPKILTSQIQTKESLLNITIPQLRLRTVKMTKMAVVPISTIYENLDFSEV